MHLGELREARSALRRRPGEPRLHGGSEAVPAGKAQAALAPAEHPRNRAQVLDPLQALA